jgi:hypothetical protein
MHPGTETQAALRLRSDWHILQVWGPLSASAHRCRRRGRSQEQAMAKLTEPDVAARLEALRRDPDVIIRERTTRAPFVPALRATSPVDVLELMGRHEEADESPEPPER